MNRKQTISLMHVCFLIAASAFGGIVYLHATILRICQRQAWIAEGVGGLLLIPLGWWILYIASKYPQKTIFEVVEITSGKLIARVFSMLYVGILLILSALVLRQFSTMIQMYFLHTTPIILVMITILLVSSVIASDGIESLARTNVISILIAYPIFYIGQGFGLIRKFEWANIFPILEKSFLSFLEGTYLSTGLLSEAILFMLIMMASIHRPSKSYRGIFYGMLVFLVFVPASVILISVGVLGPEEASHIAFAGINVAQTISAGRFIQGMESFIITTYQVIVITKLAINFFAVSDTLAYAISKRDTFKFLLFLVALSVLFLCIYTGSYNEANMYYLFIVRYVILPFIFVILSVAWIGTLLRRRGNSV